MTGDTDASREMAQMQTLVLPGRLDPQMIVAAEIVRPNPTIVDQMADLPLEP